jgi:PEP-CTERM motif
MDIAEGGDMKIPALLTSALVSRGLLWLIAMAFFSLTPLPAQAQSFFTIAEYQSPTFSDESSFHLDGIPFEIVNFGFIPEDVVLDSGSTSVPGSGETFAGVVTESLGGSFPSKSFSDAYSFTSSSTPVLDFTGGPPVVLIPGSRLEVVLTPIPSLGVREASVVIAVVPEPATWAMMLMGFVGLGLFGLSPEREGADSVVQTAPRP